MGDYTREMAREYGLRFPSRARYLRAMFADAERDGLVSQNPFSALRIAKPRRERYFPSTDEVQGLIRAAQEPLRGRIRFSAYTGLRLGEMLAVRPGDFGDGYVHTGPKEHLMAMGALSRLVVQWQMNSENERVPTKGKLKRCVVMVPRPALSARLESHLAWSKDNALGEPLWPLTRAEHNKEWNALRKALKFPENFVWHSLRHHAATWFLDQGASFEDVAIQLGHNDNGQQVRETYGHMSREKALDRLEAVVNQ